VAGPRLVLATSLSRSTDLDRRSDLPAAQVAYPGLHKHQHSGRQELTYLYPATEGLALFVLRPTANG
jgi:hypothetical protein